MRPGKNDRKLWLPMIVDLCKNYYKPRTFAHACRVARLVEDDPRVMYHGSDFRDFCITLAYCHDLYEDTDINPDEFDDELDEGICILTHRKECESYAEYCKRISHRDSEYFMTPVEYAAWLVKINDMKDHLMQKDTLTDKLKAKYLEGMAYLL